MLEYQVVATRLDAHGSVARAKQAEVPLDTDLAGRADALNPAELLLAALSACLLKSLERVAPILRFQFGGATVQLQGWRQDTPPKLARIEYTLTVDTDENDRRLELLHQNLMKYGTIYNTVAAATVLTGAIRRADRPVTPAENP